MSREELVRAAQGGDCAALNELLEVYQPDLRRYAARHCSSGDVDEAVQDALWIMYNKLGTLRFAAALSSWLFKVVRHACLRLSRESRRFEVFEDQSATSCAAQACDEHLRIDVTRALCRMEAPYREVLMLRDIQGFTAEETAARLNISVQAAKSRLHRARAAIRRKLVETAEAVC